MGGRLPCLPARAELSRWPLVNTPTLCELINEFTDKFSASPGGWQGVCVLCCWGSCTVMFYQEELSLVT